MGAACIFVPSLVLNVVPYVLDIHVFMFLLNVVPCVLDSSCFVVYCGLNFISS